MLNEDLSLKDLVNELDKGLIQNGPSDLSHQSKFIALTQDIQPRKGLKYHSIMGNTSQSNDPALITDDIVAYESAHLKQAQSEKLLPAATDSGNPEAVLELRRILRLHLQELGLYKP